MLYLLRLQNHVTTCSVSTTTKLVKQQQLKPTIGRKVTIISAA